MKRVLPAFLAMLLLMLSACGQEASQGELPADPSEPVTDVIEYPPYDTTAVYPEASGSLTLDINMDNSSMMRQAIEIYERMYPNVEIVLNEYLNTADTEAYYQSLPADLMAGKASDLIFFDFRTFSDIHKTMDSGVFADLEPYFSEDESFHPENLNRAITDGSMYRGHRFYVPLSYSLCGFLSTRETLDRVGLSGCDSLGYTDFVTTLREYAEKNRDNTDECLMLGFYPYYFLEYGNVEILNYENKTVSLDTEEFRQTMELMKAGNAYTDGRQFDPSLVLNMDALADGRVIFHFSDNTHPRTFLQNYLHLLTNGTPTAFAMPGARGKTGAYAYYGAAIPEASHNRENAWAFLKLLLSEEVQGNPSHYMQLPMNNRAREARCDLYLEGPIYDLMCNEILEETGADPREKFTPEMREHLKNLYEDVAFVIRNETLDDFVYDAMLPFFEGKKDYESCVNELRNKLELYILE